MKILVSFPVVAAAALWSACAQPGPASPAAPSAGAQAIARLQPTNGNTAAGSVSFARQPGDELLVSVELSGLPPNSEHGFHVHEKGDCSGGDGMAAGGHFNPTQQPHGPQAAAHHAGDMPSLTADASGAVRTTFRLRGATLGSGATDIVGRGLIVHAQPDDYTTQPTGNSGGRIACGVIALR